jgi:hypothetical protein
MSQEAERQLDHLGFLVETPQRVQELEWEFRGRGVRIVRSTATAARLFIAQIPMAA